MSAKNLTLYIPAETAKKMDTLQEVNWSKIARDAIEQYIKDRLDTSAPSELLIRLRHEKGEEYTQGKKLAIEKIGPNLSYKKLASFFAEARANAERSRAYEAQEANIEEEYLRLDVEGEALQIIKDFFSEIPKGSTTEFCRGVLSLLKETWDKIEK